MTAYTFHADDADWRNGYVADSDAFDAWLAMTRPATHWRDDMTRMAVNDWHIAVAAFSVTRWSDEMTALAREQAAALCGQAYRVKALGLQLAVLRDNHDAAIDTTMRRALDGARLRISAALRASRGRE